MRVVLQRVRSASVRVAGATVGSIEYGLVALVGFTHADTPADVRWMAEKLVQIRVFADVEGKMNLSVTDVAGSILVVSQFTLYGALPKGTRPSYTDAARADVAEPLYEHLLATLRSITTVPIACGIFGAMMEVELVNDGPVTIILERETP
ncbi:MAG: D-tyrosyl-tRNA(Tyr) deacylase [Bacteroidetes bacterium]|nr:D-tyrosyl-tRNA(Tyr) deacylase [Bacteroidota bacterium]